MNRINRKGFIYRKKMDSNMNDALDKTLTAIQWVTYRGITHEK